jgi:hypothetical protein
MTKADIKRLFTFRLAFYAKHCVDHVKSKNVALEIRDAMGYLLDPKEGALRCMGLDTQLPRSILLLSRYAPAATVVTPPCTMRRLSGLTSYRDRQLECMRRLLENGADVDA